MTDLNQIQDQLNIQENDMKTLPQGLNVLTILTYVGSAFQLLGGVWRYFSAERNYRLYQTLTENNTQLQDNPMSKLFGAAAETLKKQYENRTVLMIVAVLGAIACFYGALQMRNRKQIGYNVYVGAELIPPIVSLVLIGFGGMGFGGILTLAIAILFVILYTLQRKYLIN